MTRKKTIWLCVAAAVLVVLGGLVTLNVLHTRARHKGEPRVDYGTLVRYPAFPSSHVAPRTVSVWLPEGYEAGEGCAVVYMHDGQNLFDSALTWNHQTWDVDSVASCLIREGRVRPFIVVAIDNTDARLDEYFPGKPEGDAYLQFVTKEVKPFVDSLYHPLAGPENTFILGSSMGGLISLYALCEYPEVFGGAVCMSPHFSLEYVATKARAGELVDYLRKKLPAAGLHRLYFDRGTKGFDAKYGPYQQEVDAILLERGWDDTRFRSLEFKGHDHGEVYWNARLEVPLEFMLAH